MGILSNIKEVMIIAIEEYVEKHEKPDRILERYIKNIERELGQIKSETANFIAIKKSADRRLEMAKENVRTYERYVEQAMKAGNEYDAREFIKRQMIAENIMTACESTAKMATENAEKAVRMHQKLMGDIGILRMQRDEIKSIYSVACTTHQLIAAKEEHIGHIGDNASTLGRMHDAALYETDKEDALLYPKESRDEEKHLEGRYNSYLNRLEIDRKIALAQGECV